ncbi:HNH/Endo VII superfamily toxin with a SHH signature [Halogranum amylolyticum]|uniref:HNH/Endo VII superfamily toxin with a SHH signature n=1 Tax=Halogranum amylolyticum TaxID=660520 RepID=A0A1H8WFX6_9EURY|nr:HNH/Endo VII superfamily toxin with a SHH signature [Halogranum amylolyticum]
MTWNLQLRDAQSRPYLLRALVTPGGDTIFPQNVRIVDLFIRQLGLTPEGRGVVPTETARRFVFDEIDRLVGAGETQRASELLAELGAFAFRLLPFERKARYIRVLVDAWTYQPQERAIVEILTAAESRSELEAIVQLLRDGGIFDSMFDDLDSELWNLLISVGSRFADPGGISGTELLDIALSLGFQLLPGHVDDPLEEAEEAWYGLVRWAVGTLEGVWSLLTEADKIVDGLHQLAMLIKMMALAVWGDARAQTYLSTIGEQLASSTVSGLKGAILLGVTEDVIRRVKWAIIWEAASWFVGVGEVKALLTGGRAAGRSAVPLARISGSLMGFGGIENATAIAQKFQRLARLMSRASRASPTDTLRYLSYLPDDELVRLGRALDSVNMRSIRRLADIGGDTSDVVQSALERVRVLRALERTAGTLTDDLVAGLSRLMRHPEANAERLTNLMRLIDRQDTDLYMLVVRNISDVAIEGGLMRQRTFAFFERLAQRPRVLGFIHNHGYETFSLLLRRSNYRYTRFTRYLDAIESILRGEGAVVQRSFLDELRDESSRAWRQVERHTRQLREVTTGGVLRQVGDRYVYRRRRDGAEIWEYEVGPYHRMVGQDPGHRGTASVFQAHHAVQGAWARARIPGYNHNNAPTILLRDSYRGSPHQIITGRQRARQAGLQNRSFSDELRNVELDLIEAEVPPRFRDEILNQVEDHFGDLYRELQQRLLASQLRDIFGDWTPDGS